MIVLIALLALNTIAGQFITSKVMSFSWSSAAATATRQHEMRSSGGQVRWVSDSTAFWLKAYIPSQVGILGLLGLTGIIYRKRGKKALARVGKGDLAPDVVLGAALEFRTPRIMLMTLPCFYLWVGLFWGGRFKTTAPWFSAAAVCTALIWATAGWKPWAMKTHQMLMGYALRQDGNSPIQQVTVRFFRSPRCRWIQGGWVAAGAVLPWLIYAVSAMFDGKPFLFTKGPHADVTPWWGMALFGVIAAVQGRGPALWFLADALQKAWPDLLKEASRVERDEVA